MNLLHDSSEPDDPIVTSPLLWLICFPLAMGIETVRSLSLRRLERGELGVFGIFGCEVDEHPNVLTTSPGASASGDRDVPVGS